MEYPFAFDKPGTDKEFFGRRKELAEFVDIIINRQKGVTIFSPVKTGKESFVRQGFIELERNNFDFVICELDLSFIKTQEQFERLYIAKVVELYNRAMTTALMKFDINISSVDINTALTLPKVISAECGKTVIVYFKEFQNILSFINKPEDFERLEKILLEQKNVRYIFTGSFVNSMKYIFEERCYFYHIATIISLPPLPKKECIDYITLSMRVQGKIIEDSEAESIYDAVSGHVWYIKRVCSTCCSYLVGYITPIVVSSAINSLISVLKPHFMTIMHELTPNQVNFVRAVVDDVARFSSQGVLEKYNLSSSANVCRIKDTLKRRELVTFDRNDKASFVDPLFKYWLKTEYFKV